jgi:glycine hydroxymethyltransferase
MNDTWAQLSGTARQYIERVAGAIGALPADRVASRIVELVDGQEKRRRQRSLNMNAAENAISRNARRLLDRDLATRVSEGPPGARFFPIGGQNDCVDELEAIIITLARRLFRAEFVEWRATSTTMANTVVLFALTKPGDTLLVQSMEGGANMGYHPGAIPSIRGLAVTSMPVAGDYFEVDLDGVRRLAKATRPSMLIVGGSYVLFPYPVRELRAIADEVGALLLYDAAHVALLVATGLLPDPLAEGAHVLSMSTHKIMGGPVGGLVVTNEPDIAQKLWTMPFPQLMQTRDQNKYAATAYTLNEMTAFGQAYAQQMVTNARALADALAARGFAVIAAERGYTMTHQIFVDAHAFGARKIEALCQECNILLQASHMRGDTERGLRTGLRLSVQEITRQGMREKEMERVATLIKRVTLDGEPPARVAPDVEALVTEFGQFQFGFDDH